MNAYEGFARQYRNFPLFRYLLHKMKIKSAMMGSRCVFEPSCIPLVCFVGVWLLVFFSRIRKTSPLFAEHCWTTRIRSCVWASPHILRALLAVGISPTTAAVVSIMDRGIEYCLSSVLARVCTLTGSCLWGAAKKLGRDVDIWNIWIPNSFAGIFGSRMSSTAVWKKHMKSQHLETFCAPSPPKFGPAELPAISWWWR